MRYTKGLPAPPLTGRMVVVGYENTSAVCAYSTNFNSVPTFTNSTTTFANINYSGGQGIAYGLGVFVTCGSAASATTTSIAYSTNGVTWTQVTNSGGLGTFFYRIAFGNGAFIAAGGTGLFRATTITSSSSNWTKVATINARAITYIGGTNWIAGSNGVSTSIDNGVTWSSAQTISNLTQIRSIEYDGTGVYIATGFNSSATNTGNKIARSTDGTTWSLITNTVMHFGNIVKFNNGVWLCGGTYTVINNPILLKSVDNGVSWTTVLINTSGGMTSVNGIWSDGTRWYISGGGAANFMFAYSSNNNPSGVADFTFVSGVTMTGDIAVSYT